jgi:hypothetical protein
MSIRKAVLAAVAVVAGSAGVAMADPRPFTFTSDAYPMGKGDWEYEQWVTWKSRKDDDHGFNRLEFRHEFEFGLADNFDLAVYFPEWQWEKSEGHDDTDFKGGSIEGIVYLMNPVKDPFGLALYAEVGVGEDELKFEQKIIVQKDVGKWILAYNLVLETELEHVFDDDEETETVGEIKHTFGVSYAVAPSWLLGGELIVESEYEDWSHHEHTAVYAGPVVSYQGGSFGKEGAGWWVTVTPTIQLTDEEEEPAFVTRVLFGLSF